MENVHYKYTVDDSQMSEICNQMCYVLYPDKYIIQKYSNFCHEYFIILSPIFNQHLTIALSSIFVAS